MKLSTNLISKAVRECRPPKRISLRSRKTSKSGKPQPNSRKNKRRNGRYSKPGSLPVGVDGQAADTVSEPAKAVRQEHSSIKTLDRGQKGIKTVDRSRKAIKQTSSAARGTVKTTSKSIKTAETTAKASIKTSQQAAKAAQQTAIATARAARVAAHAARAAAIATAHAIKVAAKATGRSGESHHCGYKGFDCGHRSRGLDCGTGGYRDLSDRYDNRFLLWYFLLR